MHKSVDKFKLIPNNDSQNINVLPRKKLKVFILLIILSVFLIVLYRNISRNIFFIDFKTNELHTLEGKETNSNYVSYRNGYDYEDETENFNEESIENFIESNVTKNILFWTKFFNNPDWYTGKDEAGEEVLKSVKCPVTNCFFTHNKNLLGDVRKFDAIAFHGPEYRRDPLPTVRNPNQLYIFVSLE